MHRALPFVLVLATVGCGSLISSELRLSPRKSAAVQLGVAAISGAVVALAYAHPGELTGGGDFDLSDPPDQRRFSLGGNNVIAALIIAGIPGSFDLVWGLEGLATNRHAAFDHDDETDSRRAALDVSVGGEGCTEVVLAVDVEDDTPNWRDHIVATTPCTGDHARFPSVVPGHYRVCTTRERCREIVVDGNHPAQVVELR